MCLQARRPLFPPPFAKASGGGPLLSKGERKKESALPFPLPFGEKGPAPKAWEERPLIKRKRGSASQHFPSITPGEFRSWEDYLM
jgi:hypothetical protein